MYDTIPFFKIPYTLDDLSVVIPHIKAHQKRFEWFIPQYIKATPSEVIKNTIVTYDGDDFSKNILDKFRIKGVVVTESDWSTYKQMEGFKNVNTRLCARMHNDACIIRSDWAQCLVSQFNSTSEPQMIGALNPTGFLAKEWVDKMLEMFPSFKPVYDQLKFDYNPNGHAYMPCNYFSAFFLASQSYVLKTIYHQAISINDFRMDKEDCMLTVFACLYNIQLTSWQDMYSFVCAARDKIGDFEEGDKIPPEPIIVDDTNRENMPKAVFHPVRSIVDF